MRLQVYAVLWGTALLGCLAKWSALPGEIRLVGWLSAILANAPGVMVVGQLFGYLWVRTIPGYLLSALLSMLLWEPVVRWLERPVSRSRRVLLVGGAGLMLTGYGAAVERVNTDAATWAFPRVAAISMVRD